MTVSYGGLSHYVYQVPGISNLGYIFSIGSVGLDGPVNNTSTSEWKTARQLWGGSVINNDPYPMNNFLWYVGKLQLIKLSNNLSGPFPVSSSFVLASEKIQLDVYQGMNLSLPIISTLQFPEFAFSMTVKIIDDLPRSCTSPSVPTVFLPTVWPSSFNGQGTTTGETPFEIKFNNCTDNLASITYKFTPTNSTPSPNPSLGLLGNSGSATSVAVQIVHDNPQRTVVPLNVDNTLSAPSPVDDFQLKLRARYYQTGTNPPTGGTVQAAMIVHLVYN